MNRTFKRVLGFGLAVLTFLASMPVAEYNFGSASTAYADDSTTKVVQGKSTYMLFSGTAPSVSGFDSSKVVAVLSKDGATLSDGTVTVTVLNQASAPDGMTDEEKTALGNTYKPTISGSTIKVPLKITASSTADVDATYSIYLYYAGTEIKQNVQLKNATRPTVSVDTNYAYAEDRYFDFYCFDIEQLSGDSGTYTLNASGKWLNSSNNDITSYMNEVWEDSVHYKGDKLVFKKQKDGTYTHTETTKGEISLGTFDADAADSWFRLYDEYAVNNSVTVSFASDGASNYYWKINDQWATNDDVRTALYEFLYIYDVYGGRNSSLYNEDSNREGNYSNIGTTIIVTQTAAPVTEDEAGADFEFATLPALTFTLNSDNEWVTTTTGFFSNAGTAVTNFGVYDLQDIGIYFNSDYVTPVAGDTITYSNSSATYTSINQKSNKTFVYSGTDNKWHDGTTSGSAVTLKDYGVSTGNSNLINGDTIAFTGGASPAVSITCVTAPALSGPSSGATLIPSTEAGTYTYNGSKYLNGSKELTDLSSYGYTLTGTPRSGDQITIKAYDNGIRDIATAISFSVVEPHHWSYAAEGASIKAYCSDAGCTYYGTADDLSNAVSLNINVNSMDYTGSADTADYGTDEADTWQELTELTAPTISYYKLNSESAWESMSSAPVTVGSYKASATMTVNGTGYTAYKEFTITPAKVTSVSFTEPTVAATGTPAGNSDLAISSSANYTGSISWAPSVTNFAYNSVYTATVTLAVKDNYVFDTAVTYPDGWTKSADSTTTSTILTKEYPATAKAKITAVTAPSVTSPLTAFTTEAAQLSALPTSVAVTVEDSSVTSMAITWALKTGSSYSTASEAENVFTWTVTASEYTDFDTNSMALSGDVTIKNPQHVHSWQYSADASHLYAYCTKNGETSSCTYDESNKIALTVSETDKPYTGSAVDVITIKDASDNLITDTTNNLWIKEGISAPTVEYSSDEGATWSATAPTAVGSYTLRAYPAGETASETNTVTLTFNVLKAAPAITAPTANAPTYDGTAQALLTAGTSTEGTFHYRLGTDGEWSTSVPTATNAGTYTVYYYVTGDDNHSDLGSESEPSASIDATIAGKAMTVSDNDYSGDFDDEPHTITVTVTDPSDATITYSTSENGTYTATNPEYEDCGTYTVYYKVEKENYVTTTGSATITINGLTLGDVTANDVTATYDGNSNSIEVECATEGTTVKYGTAAGAYNLTGSPAYKNADTYTVYYEISKRGYNPKTGSATITINKKAVTATVTAAGKVYDGTATATVTATVPADSIVSGDTITITGLTGTFADVNVGTSIAVTVDATGKAIAGTGSGNYDVTIPSSASADITKAESSIATAPKASTKVIGAGAADALITAGSSTTGSLEYKVTDSKNNVKIGWSASLPTAATITAAGKYKVYYRVIGDSNHNDKEASTWFVNVTVYKGSVSVNNTATISAGSTGVEATGATCDNLEDIAPSQVVEHKDVTLKLEAVAEDPDTVENKEELDTEVSQIFPDVSEGDTTGKLHKEFLDIHITKSVSGEADTQVSVTSAVLEICVDYALSAGDKKPMIFRYHDNAAKTFSVLGSRPEGNYTDGTFYVDQANDKIYIYSKYFSDYVIAYIKGGNYTVSLNLNGGKGSNSLQVLNDTTIDSTNLPTPSRTGYKFKGWYSDEALTTAFTTTTVTDNMTVYAKWAKIVVSSSSGSSSGTTAVTETTVPLTYTVMKGDYLFKIARMYGITITELKALNPQIRNINRIYPGQVINVGTTTGTVTTTTVLTGASVTDSTASATETTDYVVKSGDTMSSIARRNNMSLAKLAGMNTWIKNLHWIYPGQVIKVSKIQ